MRVSWRPLSTPVRFEPRTASAADHSDRNSDAIVSAAVSRTVTRNVSVRIRRSPVAARWPARAAAVMPPAQAPTRCTSGLPAMRAAVVIASSEAAT